MRSASEQVGSEDHYGVQIRWVIGPLFASTFVLIGAAACSDDIETVTCVVKLGAEQSSVPLETNVGASTVATVGSYSVTFSILEGRKLQAEARDAESTLMTVTAGDVSGEASGSTGTADGQLEFSCAP
jgi:hypothetical protein